MSALRADCLKWGQGFGLTMSKRVQALMLVVLMALSPLVPMASAADSIGLSVDTPHVIMSPGDADNLTLSIHNNGTSIVSYNLSVADQPNVWNVTLSQTTISNVIPTTTVSTSIAIRLSIHALPSDSGSVTITVTEPESNTTTEISVVLSVLPRYLPAIDASTTGDNGLVEMEPGQSLNLSVEVTNDGNVDDTLLLSVDQSPDLLGFWANWTSGANQSTNNSSNDTGGNNSSGNNTGGNLSQVWSTPVTLDSTYNVGEQSSLAIDSNNHLHVTYLDYTSFNLEYVTYDGSSWSTPVSLDSTDNVGWQSSLAIDSNDNLHVTYYDLTYDNLEYMTYDGSSWSTPASIDSTDDVGGMSSLAIDSNDHLHVTYLDNTNGNLEYMTYDGSSWSTPVTLDSGWNVGYYSSLAIDSNDNLHVTYQDEVYDNLEYVTYDGSSWSSPVTLDSTDDVGYYPSLAIDSNDNLHVTYLDYTNYNLEYMTYDGSSWSTPVSLDSTDDVGWQPSLAIDSNDNLHVTYLDNTNDNLEYMTHDGSSWSTPVSLDSTDDVGSDSSLAIDSNDNLHVTYYDYTNENLEYMFSSNSAGGNNTGNNSNGTILMSSPNGWEVRFFDDTMDNMSAGESRMATLRISIPAHENPGYYGFDLFAATTFGNFSVSSTLVVNVTAVHDLRFSYIPSGVMLQPGQNTTVRLDITSLSSADANWTWGISVESGNCQAILPYHTTFVTAGGSVSVDVNISANPNNYAGDECLFSLAGVLDSDNSITESVQFTLIVGQQWNLSMLLPSGVKMDVGFNENILVLLTNNGTEEDDLLLEAEDVDGMIITTPEPVTLARGESKYIDVTLLADSSISGNITVNFTLSSANSAGGYIESSMIVDVTTFGAFTISGPNDNRLVVVPGSNGSVSLNLSNSGTQDLNLEPSLLGLPSGISVVSGNENVVVEVNNSTIVEITLFADAGIQPYSDDITIGFSNGIASASITIELQIINRIEVSIGSVDSRVVASPLYAKNVSLVITNLGTDTGTFLIDVDTSQSSDWFDVSLDSLSQNLAAGQSGSLTLSVREIATGAPSSGATLSITVTSTSDSTVNDTLTLSLVPQIADGIITIMSDDDSAEPGETIHGTVIVTNMGTATDWMTITTLELDCNLDQQIELGPSMSSIPLPWSCTLPEQASAGLDIVTFRLTSSARSDMLVTTLEAYTIEPIWDSNGVIIFTISEDNFEMNMQDDRKIMVRVCNHANIDVSGVIEVTGTNSLRMNAIFSDVGGEELNSSFELANLGCKDFNLLLVTQDLEGYDASIIVRAVTQVDGSTIIDESEPITVTVKGPEQPPEGINFGFMELNNKNSMTALASGWILTLLLLAYIRYFRKPAIEEEEEEEEELAELGFNEVRIDENGKVTCCSCDQLLGVPRGSEPPFKFTCPKCSEKIRVVE